MYALYIPFKGPYSWGPLTRSHKLCFVSVVGMLGLAGVKTENNYGTKTMSTYVFLVFLMLFIRFRNLCVFHLIFAREGSQVVALKF